MIEVKQTVNICEENGEENPIGKRCSMLVESHWDNRGWVVLKIGKECVSVKATDLEVAVHNATNTNWP